MTFNYEALDMCLQDGTEGNCPTCKYAKESQYKAIYHCRRFPPQIDPNSNSRFPRVTQEDSCGEHRRRSV